MRSISTVILLAGISVPASTGCGATQAGSQRCCSSGVAVAAGSALVVAGLVVTATAESDCSDSFGVCLDVDQEHLLGPGMLVAGGALVIAGLYGGIGQPAGLAGRPAPRPAPDPAACIEWRRSVERETEPARRETLRAARPSHCAPVLAPAAGGR